MRLGLGLGLGESRVTEGSRKTNSGWESYADSRQISWTSYFSSLYLERYLRSSGWRSVGNLDLRTRKAGPGRRVEYKEFEKS